MLSENNPKQKSAPERPFTKANLDQFLKDLAKEYRRRSGKSVPAEIILIGGASIVANYGFREMTYDIDALISAASSMKEAINAVGDMHGLPNGWMNEDFRTTVSYTEKISQYSKHYRSFYGVLNVRSVAGEYLVAMKLRAGRQYKHDLSDVIGVLLEQKKAGDPLTMERIRQAVSNLYGSYDVLTDEIRTFIEKAVRDDDYQTLLGIVRRMEEENREILLEMQEARPAVIQNDNADDILATLRKRQKKGTESEQCRN